MFWKRRREIVRFLMRYAHITVSYFSVLNFKKIVKVPGWKECFFSALHGSTDKLNYFNIRWTSGRYVKYCKQNTGRKHMKNVQRMCLENAYLDVTVEIEIRHLL